DRPLTTKDGGTLRTIRDAFDYMDRKRERLDQWQRVCKLILAKEDVLIVSRALELALFMDAKLDVSKIPAKIKAPAAKFGSGRPGRGLGMYVYMQRRPVV